MHTKAGNKYQIVQKKEAMFELFSQSVTTSSDYD